MKLPRPPVIRRSGLRRRRNHAVIGSALAVLVTIGAGALVRPDAGTTADAQHARPGALVSKKMLLTSAQVAPLAPREGWRLVDTNDNTLGSGINTMCQGAQFADMNGLGTWVRRFTPAASTSPQQDLVQTVEISDSPGAAQKAYDTTLGWYAGCTVPRIQLVDAYDVQGVGEQAIVLRMRIPDRQPRSFLVGIARTGSLTTSTVLESRTARPGDPRAFLATLGTSVQDLCSSEVAGACVARVTSRPTLPVATGSTPGMLAIADLPAIADVAKAWAATDPVPATVNVAATTCDKTDFVRSGAPRAMTRSYLIPETGLPKRFGLTETMGRFATPKAAKAVVSRIVARMQACGDKELGSTVSQGVVRVTGVAGPSYALWRLQNQVNQNQELVPFWMGVVQVGTAVAQVNLTPVGKYDVDRRTFEALVVRARDRLQEVQR